MPASCLHFTRISKGGTFKDHRKRGSLGGIDLVAAIGTQVYAPYSGKMTHQPANGTLGNTVSILAANGDYTQMGHLSSYIGNARQVKEGELIARSGNNVAAGPPVAPHVHWHTYVNGVRVDPLARIKALHKAAAAAAVVVIKALRKDPTVDLFYVTQKGLALPYRTWDGLTFATVPNQAAASRIRLALGLVRAKRISKPQYEAMAAQGAKHLAALRAK